jgi:putative redox protein
MERTIGGSIELLGGKTFKATSGTGHAITLDAAFEEGGADHGARPIELLLLGLGGCAAMDVAELLRKTGQDVTGYEVHVRGERASTSSEVLGQIGFEHVVRGRRVNPAAVHRAIEISGARYWAVLAMLGRPARIGEQYRVVDEDTGAETHGVLNQLPTATS